MLALPLVAACYSISTPWLPISQVHNTVLFVTVTKHDAFVVYSVSRHVNASPLSHMALKLCKYLFWTVYNSTSTCVQTVAAPGSDPYTHAKPREDLLALISTHIVGEKFYLVFSNHS